MYLLYLDDSGSAQNLKEEHLVLGGVCLHEHQVPYFTQQLESIAARLAPKDPSAVEFHASEIFSGRQTPWKDFSKPERIATIKEVLQVVARSYNTVRLFACAVHKASQAGRDPMEVAFEDLCSRFDKLLWRLKNEGDHQRGLIVLDKSAHETNLQKLAQDFRRLGTRWNVIRNIVDVPLFVDSRKRHACKSPITSRMQCFAAMKRVIRVISTSSIRVSILMAGFYMGFRTNRPKTRFVCAPLV